MIISHKYKFIFLKPTKLAGTSIEIALAKHTGKNDIVTPVSEFKNFKDSDEYIHKPQNFKKDGFYNHITPDKIKEKIGKETWDSYFKFTIVRNPWDLVVSRYYWEKNIIKKFDFISAKKAWKNKPYNLNLLIDIFNKYYLYRNYSFDFFLSNFETWWTNTRYYFDDSGEPICDYYLRYENLNEDYKNVCNKLGIECEKLIFTKNRVRKSKRMYKQYYKPEQISIVEEIFAKEIKHFNYKF